MKVPMKICAFVLRIYEKFLQKNYNYLFAEVWEYIIKLLIGLTTYVLEVKQEFCEFILQSGENAKYFDRISVGLVELLYNSWILSGLQNETLWGIFSSHLQKLVHKDM